MKTCMITFRSVTPAQRGEGVLRKAGVACTLQRTSRQMEEQGCGYSLKIRCGQIPAARELLSANQIPFRKIYMQAEGGNLEELHL